MNRRNAKRLSRRMRAQKKPWSPTPLVVPERPKSAIFDNLIAAAHGAGFRVLHLPALDERPPERETFSGGINLSARKRNIERLAFCVLKPARQIHVGKYADAFLDAQKPPFRAGVVISIFPAGRR